MAAALLTFDATSNQYIDFKSFQRHFAMIIVDKVSKRLFLKNWFDTDKDAETREFDLGDFTNVSFRDSCNYFNPLLTLTCSTDSMERKTMMIDLNTFNSDFKNTPVDSLTLESSLHQIGNTKVLIYKQKYLLFKRKRRILFFKKTPQTSLTAEERFLLSSGYDLWFSEYTDNADFEELLEEASKSNYSFDIVTEQSSVLLNLFKLKSRHTGIRRIVSRRLEFLDELEMILFRERFSAELFSGPISILMIDCQDNDSLGFSRKLVGKIREDILESEIFYFENTQGNTATEGSVLINFLN